MGKGGSSQTKQKEPQTVEVLAPPKDATRQVRGNPLAQTDPAGQALLHETERKGLLS